MRKISLLLLLFVFAGTLQAQNAQVAKIRKMYAQAKETMAQKKKAELPPDETVVTSNYMAAGAGPVKDVTRYYYSGDYDEDLGREAYEVYFMVRKYNVGAVDYYQEFLFDEEGDLAFYYEKNEGNETRFYFSKNGDGDEGLVHEINSSSRTIEPPFALRIAHELGNAFHLLMNREF